MYPILPDSTNCLWFNFTWQYVAKHSKHITWVSRHGNTKTISLENKKKNKTFIRYPKWNLSLKLFWFREIGNILYTINLQENKILYTIRSSGEKNLSFYGKYVSLSANSILFFSILRSLPESKNINLKQSWKLCPPKFVRFKCIAKLCKKNCRASRKMVPFKSFNPNVLFSYLKTIYNSFTPCIKRM